MFLTLVQDNLGSTSKVFNLLRISLGRPRVTLQHRLPGLSPRDKKIFSSSQKRQVLNFFCLKSVLCKIVLWPGDFPIEINLKKIVWPNWEDLCPRALGDLGTGEPFYSYEPTHLAYAVRHIEDIWLQECILCLYQAWWLNRNHNVLAIHGTSDIDPNAYFWK